MFKENFNPYYKNIVFVAPKFSYRTNNKKNSILILDSATISDIILTHAIL